MKESGIRLTIVQEFSEIVGLPWVASAALLPDVTASIRAGLHAIHDAAVLKALGNDTTGFVEVRDEAYNSLREAMREAEKFDESTAPQPASPPKEPKP